MGCGVGGGGECVVCASSGYYCCVYDRVIMALLFLAFRHVYLGMPLGGDTLQTLWPMWFPVAYYLGAFGYLTVLQRVYRQ